MPLVCLRYELNTTGKGRKCGLFSLFGCDFSRVIPLGGICQQHRNATPLFITFHVKKLLILSGINPDYPLYPTRIVVSKINLSFYTISAAPHNGARRFGQCFDTSESMKNAGILDVFPIFHTARLGQKIRRSPQYPLCGVALAFLHDILI